MHQLTKLARRTVARIRQSWRQIGRDHAKPGARAEDTPAPAQAYRPGSRHKGRGVEQFDTKLTSAGLPSIIVSIEQRLAERGRCRVLETGCGEGRLLLDLLAHFGQRVELHGINHRDWEHMRSEEQLRMSNDHYKVIEPARLASLPLPKIHCADLQDMGMFPEREFDFVLSQAVVPHLTDKARALEQSAQLLSEDGVFVHELDCLDLPRLDFIDEDLPRFTIYEDARRVSASQHLRAHGIELLTCRRSRVAGAGILAVYRRDRPLSLGLAIDRTSTLALKTLASCDAPLRLWGTRSVYRLMA